MENHKSPASSDSDPKQEDHNSLEAGNPEPKENLDMQMEADLIWAKERAKEAAVKAQLLEERAEQSERHLRQQERQLVSHRHDLRKAWWAMLVLAVTLIGAGWWGYSSLQARDSSLSQIPAVQETLDTLWEQVNSSKESLGALFSESDQLRDQLANLEKKVQNGLQTVLAQRQRLADSLNQSVESVVTQYLEPVGERLAGLESDQQSNRSRLASLDGEVTALREDLNQQMAGLRQNMWQNLNSMKAHVDFSKDRLDATRQDIDRLIHEVDRERTHFEVFKDQAEELMPGVYLTITDSDEGRQTFDGWLWLASDHRVLWLQEQGVLKPVVFHSLDDARPRELVFTRVRDYGAAGYLLTPVVEEAVPVANAEVVRSGPIRGAE